jgi:predicted dinucleotide-binding enzyme
MAALATSAHEAIDGEIVVLALPYGAVAAAVEQYRDSLAGRVVVDIANHANGRLWIDREGGL